MITKYHVFTNNCDEWFDDYIEALVLFDKWRDENGCARLYEEKWKNPKTDNEATEESCLQSYGEYPM